MDRRTDTPGDPATHLKAGLTAATARHWPAALAAFEKASLSGSGPAALSWLGYCIARERGQLAQGIAHCRAALQEEPDDPVHHLLLGRILLLAGDKPGALASLRKGMECGDLPELRQELNSLGARKPPVLPWLARRNPINKVLGRIGTRLGLR
jgi:hypothetical protein